MGLGNLVKRFMPASPSVSPTAPERNKFWEFAESPLTWGAIGMLAGAAGQNVSSAVIFVIAGIILSIQVWRSKPFERAGAFLSGLVLCPISKWH